MALDRHNIEKKDFPLGRRGYDPEAVDAHLSALADEIASFKEEARRRSDTVASSASDRVRTIVEAAEQSASEIHRAAEDDAREIREEATGEANATRENAHREAREYLDKVSASTNAMMERLSAMEQEMNAMIESVRTGSSRLSADLQQLESGLSDVSGAIAPRPAFVPDEPAADSFRRPRPGCTSRRPYMTTPPSPSRRRMSSRSRQFAERFQPGGRGAGRASRCRSPRPPSSRAWPGTAVTANGFDQPQPAQQGWRRGGREADRPQHGAQRHPARGDRSLPERELPPRRRRRAAGRGLRQRRELSPA